MKSHHLRLDDEVMQKVDAIRGDVPRNKWIVRLIESVVHQDPIALANQTGVSRSDARKTIYTTNATGGTAIVSATSGPEGSSPPSAADLADGGGAPAVVPQGTPTVDQQQSAPDVAETTATGRVMTDEDFEALADEAEKGYDVDHLKES